jgi:uncharacterized protein YciI
MHFLLFYDYAPDFLARRDTHRREHLELAWSAHARGELMLGGAFADTADGAALWFNGPSAAVAERFASADPYVKNGLVTRWWVRPWATVVGALAADPVHPPT